MYFVVRGFDRPGSLDVRMANREAHLAFVKGGPVKLHIAGPLTDGAGQMRGSLLIFEADSEAELRDWLTGDPYQKAGLFERVEIDAFKWVVGAPDSK